MLISTYLAYLQNLVPQRLLRSERGATAVEYGLIVTLIAVAIAGVLLTLGTNIGTELGKIATAI